MAQLIVRNLEDAVRDKIRDMAQRHGCSMEEEVRDILRAVVASENLHGNELGLGTRISRRFAECDLDEDFQVPEWRGFSATPESFE